MKRAVGLGLLAMGLGAALATAQPPRRDGQRPEPGSVLPPFVREQMKLSGDQQKQIAELESEVKLRLAKILTAEQMQQMAELMRRGPGGPPGGRPGGPGGPGGQGGPPGGRPGDEAGPPPPRPPSGANEPTANADPAAGIQWFATLDRGLAEAKRTGKAILFVSAAPHCSGISGIW